jgi:hypothetical protein
MKLSILCVASMVSLVPSPCMHREALHYFLPERCDVFGTCSELEDRMNY